MASSVPSTPSSGLGILDAIGFNKTEHRNSLNISTLNSLLALQFSAPQNGTNLNQAY